MFRKILCRDLVAGALKTGVQFGAALGQRRDGALDLFFPFTDVGIDLLVMSKIKGNRPVHLLQGERRKVLANCFRRVPGLKGIHDGVQRHRRAGDVESAVALFDVFASLHVPSTEVSGKERLLPWRKPDSQSDLTPANHVEFARDLSDPAERRINRIRPDPEFRNQQVASSILAGGSICSTSCSRSGHGLDATVVRNVV
jgi:hypothetical protein